jgi:hypothetical protein
MLVNSTLNFSKTPASLSELEKSDLAPYQHFKHWTIEEDQSLLRGIQNFGNDWEKIANTYFKISQDAFSHKNTSCYNRYIKYWRKYHTLEEIEAISEPINVICLDSIRVIANLLPQEDRWIQLALSFRNTQQTMFPSATSLADRKGKRWKREEDERLLRGIQEFGTDWRGIEKKYFPPSGQNSNPESYKRCYHRYKKYWRKFYSMEQIRSISEPIRVTGLKTSARKIANLASFSQPSKEIKPLQLTPSVPVAISSQMLESAVFQPTVSCFSDLEIGEDWNSPRYTTSSLFDSEGDFIKPDIPDMLGSNE